MPKQITAQQALQKLTAQCARAEYCSADIRRKLRLWHLPESDADEIIDYMQREKYVDDSRYSRFFVEDKLHGNGWGRMKIRQALKAKLVADDVIDEALATIPDADYLEVLMPLIKQKWHTVQAATDYERSGKVIRFAMGRGFTMDEIRHCIDQLAEADLE